MPRGTSLTLFEREHIETWLRMRKPKPWIAKRLGRDLSVVKREIRRNRSPHFPYVAVRAQAYAARRRRRTNTRKLEKEQNVKLAAYVEASLRAGHSPEEIAGRLTAHPPESVRQCRDRTVSHETIYQYVYQGAGRYGGLYQHLRRKRKVRQRKFARKPQQPRIPARISIHARPAVITERRRSGDWEVDLVLFSRQRTVLAVQYERTMQLCRLTKVVNKSAAASEQAIQDRLGQLPAHLRLSVTRDNGTENALHQDTFTKLGVPSYFCDPYASWQKGGVENLNGLVREYFPKRYRFDAVSDAEVSAVQEKLNNRPRKALGYCTPNEVLATVLREGH